MTKKPNDNELSPGELSDRQLKAGIERYTLLAKIRLKVEQEDPEEITVPDRLRALDQSKVDELAESMATIGLQQPITIWHDSPEGAQDTLYLVTGAHRLAAAIKLRWFEIDVVYVNDMTETDRQIWEIDENLVRAELSPMEHADHVTRRAKLMEARPNLGGKSFPTKPQHEWGSAAYIAEMTGLSKRAVNLALSRGRAIPEDVQDQIKGTKLDKGVYLDKIKAMPPEQQRLRVVSDLAEPKKPQATVVIDPAEEQLESLKRASIAFSLALNAATPEIRNRFIIDAIDADWRRSIESIIQTGRDLAAAQKDLSGSEFTKMVEADLPISHSTAKQLMKIARLKPMESKPLEQIITMILDVCGAEGPVTCRGGDKPETQSKPKA